MPELTKMYLGKKRLSSGIPPELGSYEKLQLLDLSGNAFSGAIPPKLGALEISLNLIDVYHLGGHCHSFMPPPHHCRYPFHVAANPLIIFDNKLNIN
jgi:hypothetical protein